MYGIIPIISKNDLLSGDIVKLLKEENSHIELSQGRYLSINMTKNMNFTPVITFDGFMFKEASAIEKSQISFDFSFPFLEGGINVLSDFAKGVIEANSIMSKKRAYDNHYLFIYKKLENSDQYEVRILSGSYNNFTFNISAGSPLYNGTSTFTILGVKNTQFNQKDFLEIFNRDKYVFSPKRDDYDKIKIGAKEYETEGEKSSIKVIGGVLDELIQYKTTVLNYQINYLKEDLSEDVRMRFYKVLQKTFVQSLNFQVSNNIDVFPVNNKPLYFRNMAMPYQISIQGTVIQVSNDEQKFLEEVFGMYEDLDTLETYNLISNKSENLDGDKIYSAIKKNNFILKVPYLIKQNTGEKVISVKKNVVLYIQPQNISVVKAGDYNKYYKISINGMISNIRKA
jgi:hypothetical protein